MLVHPQTERHIEFFGCAGDYEALSTPMLERTATVLASGQVLQGRYVEAVEARVAALAGRRYAVALGSGTDALFFALICAGIGPGDEVLVPAISFVASASAIVRAGAIPVFVDIGTDVCIDLATAQRLVTSATRALLHVHLFGAMNDPAALERFAAANGVTLIEDFAQSFGASYDGRPAGSIGVASATSFDPTKVIGAPGSGGALVTDDPAIAARVRRLRLHGKNGNDFSELGYNSQMPSLAAAIIDLKLDHHDSWTRRRGAIAERYKAGLAGLPVTLPAVAPQVAHVWHKFVILCDCRDALAAALHIAGIPTRIHYHQPLYREPLFHAVRAVAELPGAAEYCGRTLSLPIHSHLADSDVDHVTAAIRDFFA
jgi:dTDP-4-amino-4,6-dideoxygalactose transaminase